MQTFCEKIEKVEKLAIGLHTALHFEQKMYSMCRTVFSVLLQDTLAIGAASVWRTIVRQFVFSEKSVKTEKTAINRQLRRPILRLWKSRGPGSISARLAYLAARLKIRKFGVVKITWNLSRSPKTSNFEKKIPKVTHRDGYPRVLRPNCLKAYNTATRFFRKMSDELVKKQFGPRRRTYRRFTKRRKIRFLSGAKK